MLKTVHLVIQVPHGRVNHEVHKQEDSHSKIKRKKKKKHNQKESPPLPGLVQISRLAQTYHSHFLRELSFQRKKLRILLSFPLVMERLNSEEHRTPDFYSHCCTVLILHPTDR